MEGEKYNTSGSTYKHKSGAQKRKNKQRQLQLVQSLKKSMPLLDELLHLKPALRQTNLIVKMMIVAYFQSQAQLNLVIILPHARVTTCHSCHLF